MSYNKELRVSLSSDCSISIRLGAFNFSDLVSYVTNGFLRLDLSIFEKRGTKKINLELELNFHLSYTDKPRFT